MNTISRPAIRYHGGKFRLAPWVVGFFPPHMTYVEPFGGAAGVLIRKPISYAEVYNDLDGDIVNFFRVLRDESQCLQLERALALTPYAREEFESAWKQVADPVERARRTAIRAQMGFGSAGATKGCTGFRIDCRRKYGTSQHLWQEYSASIASIGLRFSGVLIENRPAIEVIKQHDAPDTLLYVDPPYMHECRVMRVDSGGSGAYRHEMTDGDHEQLLEALTGSASMIVLSGYDTPLYAKKLVGWSHYERGSRISSGRGSAVRIESIWTNPACQSALNSNPGALFA